MRRRKRLTRAETKQCRCFRFSMPTLNRAGYLERVWTGLNSQTFRSFEWIVADDGSSDDTQALLQVLSERSDFDIVVVHASQRVGKARMDNEAIARARQLVLLCDSDDYFLPVALDRPGSNLAFDCRSRTRSVRWINCSLQ